MFVLLNFMTILLSSAFYYAGFMRLAIIF